LVVAKNTLLRLAARATGKEAIESLLEGPTAITFVYDDITKAAKALNDYVRSSSKITVRGGLLGKSLLAADGLEQVTKMPSREQILAEVVGSIQSPVSSLVGLLNAPVSDVVGLVNAVTTNMVYALQARIDQLQSAGETASAA
jgi:large subunit ribosomal protein L10